MARFMVGDWSGLLNQKWGAWKEAWDEALRRDKAEAAKLKTEGWTKHATKGWQKPDGNFMFDGPGSYVSLMHHVETVAKERGIDQDIDALKTFIEKLRTMSNR